MSAIHQVETFAFDELDDSAQERVVSEVSSYLIQDAEMDWLVGQWAEELAAQGVDVREKDVHYSVSWSQGDGAAFAAELNGPDLATWMKSQKLAGRYRALYDAARFHSAWASLAESRGYGIGRVRAEIDGDSDCTEKANAQMAAVHDALEEWAQDQAHRLYAEIRDELESYWDAEYVREHCDANGYEFYESGEMYP